MRDLLSPDSGPMRFLTRVCDLMLLNLMLVCSCLTIVLSGASVTALYSVTLKMVRAEDGGIVKGFLGAVKENFTASTPATVLLFADVMLLAVLRYALYAETLVFSPALFLLLAVITLLLTALLSYLFPLIARFQNTFLRHLENAVRLALANLPVTFLLTLVNLLPLLSVMLFPALYGGLAAFWLFIGLAGGAWVNSFYLRRIFDR